MSSTSAQGLIALSSTLLGLSTLAVTLRFYARHTQKAPLKNDDLIMIPCLFLFIGATGCSFFGVRKKILGYPTPKDLKKEDDTAGMAWKVYLVFGLISTSLLGCTKIGALLFYRRIFCTATRQTFFARITLITIIVVALWTAGFNIFAGLVSGTHFSAPGGPHIDANKGHQASWLLLLSLSISDFLLDLWILALPLPQIWAIQTSLKRRLGIIGVFFLALVGLAACIARLMVTIQIFHAGPEKIFDGRLINTKQLYLCMLENGLNLIAVNLPSLWCFFSKVQLESVLHSVRSILSFRSSLSATSMRRTGSHLPLPPIGKNRSASGSSLFHLAHLEAQPVETYAICDIEEENIDARLPQENT